MPQSQNNHPIDRIMTEHDLPINVYQLIDDVSVNGAVIVLRENRPSIRITPEPEMEPAQEQLLFHEAMIIQNDPDARWFGSAEDLVTNLEAGDEQ